MKSCYLFILLITINLISAAQNKQIIKLYNKAQYEECIKVCTDEIGDDAKNNFALLYKSMCMCQLSKNADYAKKNKNAVEQSLDLLKRIAKNDADRSFRNQNTENYNVIKVIANKAGEDALQQNNLKKATTIFTALALNFDDFYTRANEAKVLILNGNNTGSAKYQALLSETEKKDKDYLTQQQINTETFKNLIQFFIDHPSPAELFSTLLTGMKLFNCAQEFENIFMQQISEFANKTYVNTELLIQSCENAYRTCNKKDYLLLKWKTAFQLQETKIKENKALGVIASLETYLNNSSEKDLNLQIFLTGAFKYMDESADFDKFYIDFILQYFMKQQKSGFSALIKSKAIEKYCASNNIKVSKDFTDKLSLIEKQYDNYLKNIPKLTQKKDFTNAGIQIYNALTQFPNDSNILILKKNWVIEDYKQNYLTTEISNKELNWTGSTDKCTEGTISKLANDRFLKRLNYIRRFAGLPEPCELKQEYNLLCQKAALMMTANYDLSHHPPKTWSCYTDDGAKGAGSSNLSLGYNSTAALTGQVRDDGSHNIAVGHRRWILFPPRRVYGHGSTNFSMSLYVFDGEKNFADSVTSQYRSRFVSWPPADFVPIPLVFERWSFSLMGGEFKNTKVEMTVNGTPIGLKINEIRNGYGANTIVWEPNFTPEDGDIISVSVKNVEFYTDEIKDFQYFVKIIDVK